jgi:hypothetical protein
VKATVEPRYSEHLNDERPSARPSCLLARSPSAQSLTAHERDIPNHVDVSVADPDHDTLHGQRHTAGSRILYHDDTVAEEERLSLEAVDRVARLENSLSWDPLDHGALDRVVRLGRAELVRQLLNKLDRFLLP